MSVAHALGEGAGVCVGDEHSQFGLPVGIEHPAATTLITDGDHGASPAAVDAAPLHGAPFLLALRQVVRPVQPIRWLFHGYPSLLVGVGRRSRVARRLASRVTI
jgi:hypothetical protein